MKTIAPQGELTIVVCGFGGLVGSLPNWYVQRSLAFSGSMASHISSFSSDGRSPPDLHELVHVQAFKAA